MALMSVVCQGTDYTVDLTKHSFWKENAEKVCEDEEDIRGKIVIVTGSNTGIGKQTALQIAKRGAMVIMAVRNLEKGQSALDDIKKELEGREIHLELMKIDMGDLQSIRDFVSTFQSKYDHLDILVNNAGLMDTNPTVQKTEDGFEQHIGVNHLGPFLLTRLLLPFLKKAESPRIVCVASSKVMNGTLNFMEDLMMEKKWKKGDNGMEQYNISKLANAICCMKLSEDQELMGGGQVKLFQVCPGFVKSDVYRNNTGIGTKLRMGLALGVLGITTHQGCETVVYCAVAKSVAEVSGKGELYRFKKIWGEGEKNLREYLKTEGGMETADKLYKLSEELTGLRGVGNGGNVE